LSSFCIFSQRVTDFKSYGLLFALLIAPIHANKLGKEVHDSMNLQ
jgi:hypothetical protein